MEADADSSLEDMIEAAGGSPQQHQQALEDAHIYSCGDLRAVVEREGFLMADLVKRLGLPVRLCESLVAYTQAYKSADFELGSLGMECE